MVTPLLTQALESGRNAREYYFNYPALSHRALLPSNSIFSIFSIFGVSRGGGGGGGGGGDGGDGGGVGSGTGCFLRILSSQKYQFVTESVIATRQQLLFFSVSVSIG